jgi:hypothetical protein
VSDVEGLARILGCRVAPLLMKYLGLLLRASYNYIYLVFLKKWNVVWVVGRCFIYQMEMGWL